MSDLNQNGQPGLDNGPISESSGGSDFVIISQHGPNPSSQASHNGTINHDQIDISLQQSMATGDFSSVEALNRIRDLVKENQELKDTLQQNNETFKQHTVILQEWKKKVELSQENVKNKYNESKRVVTNLRQQKKDLEKKVKDMEVQLQSSKSVPVAPEGDDILQLTAKLEELEGNNKLLLQRKSESDNLIQALRKEIEKLQNKDGEARATKEESELKGHDSASHRAEVYAYQVKQEEVAKLLEEEKLQNQTLQEELNHNFQQIEELTAKCQELKEELKKQEKISEENKSRFELEVGKVKSEMQKLRDSNEQLLVDKKELLTLNNELHAKLAELKSTASGYVTVERMQKQGAKELTEVRREEESRQEKSEDQLQLEQRKNADLMNEIGKKEATISDREQEIQALKQKLDESSVQSERKMKEFKQQIRILEEQLQHAHENIPTNTKEDVAALRAQIVTMLTENQEQSDRLLTTERKLEEMKVTNEKLTERNNKLQQELEGQRCEDDTLIDQMRIAIQQLEHAVKTERTEHQQTKRKFEETRQNFDQLCNDYHQLLNTFDQYRATQEAKEAELPAQQAAELRTLREKLDNLTAQLFAAEEAVQDKDDELKHTKDRSQQFQTENDVLKVQAEVFKRDFEVERKAREEQHTERQRLLTDMNQLQIQNQQLQDELDSYNRRQMEEFSMRYRNANQTPGGPGMFPRQVYGNQVYHPQPHPHHPPPQTPHYLPPIRHDVNPSPSPTGHHRGSSSGGSGFEDSELRCPKCNVVCPDMDTLQIHVVECLDE